MFLKFTDVFLVVVLSVLSVSSDGSYNVFDTRKDYGYLLPKTSEPIHYDLNLLTHIGPKFEYNGTVGIDIFVFEPTKSLTVHSSKLDIDLKRSFVQTKSGVVDIVSTATNDDYQFLNLELGESISKGYYKLVLAFSGNYYTVTMGLFLDQYKTPEGEVRYLLATHFEPAKARLMFPCYDEPFYRTSFDIHVTHRKDYNAVSNAPVKSVEKYSDDYVTTHFERSANFSTYLLALGVSDFDTFVFRDARDRSYRLLTNPANINHTNDGLEISVKTIKYLEEVTKVNYILPKLDSIAVPKFGGGMENWGLIVYGTSVARDFLNSTSRKGTTELITHEISHQWFGDLVTLAWWDYVWLNEGFATYYAAMIGDKILPEERFMYNLVNKFQVMLRDDSYNRTWAINAHVETPAQFSQKFDSVSYTKGAAVIRFMDTTLRSYDRGITAYLDKYQQKNTVPKNLLDELQKHAGYLPDGVTLEQIMNSWLNKQGFPLVTVNATKVEGAIQVVVSQEKYNYEDKFSKTKWWIPIHLTGEEYPVFAHNHTLGWLRDVDESVIFYLEDFEGWVLINLQQSIFCRVNYDEQNWNHIIRYLKASEFEKIHVLNRAQLVDDALNLAEYGKLKHEITLDLLEYLEQENDELPHRSAERGIRRYLRLLEGTEAHGLFKNYITKIYNDKTRKMDETPDLASMVQNTLDSMQKRHVSSVEEFNNVVDAIFTEEDFEKLTNILKMRFRSVTSPDYYNEFVEKISHRYKHNLLIKERFMESDHHVIEKWLKAKMGL